MNAVFRDGDAVPRTGGPWTETVHRYLRYIARNGIEWAPKPLDFDGERERLSYIDGTVPVYPLPDWVWTDDVLVDGARRLRQLHEASIGFGIDGAIWQAPTKVPLEVICHNDFSPHNLAFIDGNIVGAIDFDMCSPGPRIWDLAYYATRIVPLTAAPPSGEPNPHHMRRRIELILNAYGSSSTWIDVMRVAITRLYDLAEFSKVKAAELGNAELNDDAVAYVRDAKYLTGLISAG